MRIMLHLELIMFYMYYIILLIANKKNEIWKILNGKEIGVCSLHFTQYQTKRKIFSNQYIFFRIKTLITPMRRKFKKNFAVRIDLHFLTCQNLERNTEEFTDDCQRQEFYLRLVHMFIFPKLALNHIMETEDATVNKTWVYI